LQRFDPDPVVDGAAKALLACLSGAGRTKAARRRNLPGERLAVFPDAQTWKVAKALFRLLTRFSGRAE
jgi:hypothetical protein